MLYTLPLAMQTSIESIVQQRYTYSEELQRLVTSVEVNPLKG